MNIPDFIRTKWKSRGGAIVQISDLNCEECQSEWGTFLEKKDEEHQSNASKKCSIHSKYITCYMSALDVWEFKFRPRQKKTYPEGEIIESKFVDNDEDEDSGVEMPLNEYDEEGDDYDEECYDSDFSSNEPCLECLDGDTPGNEVTENSQPNFESDQSHNDSAIEKYCEPWYAIFSPFWWLGYSLDKENTLVMQIKKREEESVNYFVSAFHPHVRKSFCDPCFLSENLHITKVEEFNDERSPIHNLIKIGMKTKEEAESSPEIFVHYMLEDDIDNEVYNIFYRESNPHSIEFSKPITDGESITAGNKVECQNLHVLNSPKKVCKGVFTSPSLELNGSTSDVEKATASKDNSQISVNLVNSKKKTEIIKTDANSHFPDLSEFPSGVKINLTTLEDCQKLYDTFMNSIKAKKIEKVSRAASKFEGEDWFHNAKVSFDENDNQVLVNATFNPQPLRVKMREILRRHYRLMRFSYKDWIPLEDMPPDLPQELSKYWIQRYRLFLKYDSGIKLNNEAWFSVTPEMIAAHQAYRCACDTVVDAFCGAGSNAIQLALTCNRVIAIDIDSKVLEIARNNARVYGVEDRIKFIQGDFFKLASSLKADVVLLSPPWGGINYNKDNSYDVLNLEGSMNCKLLIDTARKISQDIALYIPKTSNLLQVIELAGVNGKVDIEFHYISKKRKAITAYYGALVDFYEENS